MYYDQLRIKVIAIYNAGSEVPALDWDTRMRIAVDAANGFSYLHENCESFIYARRTIFRYSVLCSFDIFGNKARRKHYLTQV